MHAFWRFFFSFALAIVVVGSGTLFYIQKQAAKYAGGPPKSNTTFKVPVEVFLLKKTTQANELTTVGELLAEEVVQIQPEIAGILSHIHCEEGHRVKKDQLLFSIEDSIQKAEVERAKAALLESKTSYERTERLYQKGTQSEQARDKALSVYERDLASLSLAQATHHKMHIKAPFDGILGLRQASLGKYLHQGDSLISLAKIDEIKVEFQIPEKLVPLIREGQHITFTIEALPTKIFQGIIYATESQLDPNTRTQTARAKAKNPDFVLNPGFFAIVNIQFTPKKNRLLVPEQAIVPRKDAHFVYIVDNAKAKLVPVILGARNQGKVEILDGLTENEWIITSGHMKLQDGVEVFITEKLK